MYCVVRGQEFGVVLTNKLVHLSVQLYSIEITFSVAAQDGQGSLAFGTWHGGFCLTFGWRIGSLNWRRLYECACAGVEASQPSRSSVFSYLGCNFFTDVEKDCQVFPLYYART